MGARRVIVVAAACCAVMIAAAVATPLIGSASISYRRALEGHSPDREILFYARAPRVALALLAGGSLAVAGVLFQALLRDALATPYTLGVSSGASLGAVIAITFGLSNVWMPAIAGAALTLALVLGVASEGRRLSSFTLLLTGVTINSICLAAILFLQNLGSIGRSFAAMRWLMGGIESLPYAAVAWLSAALLPVCAFAFFHARKWNLLAAGEDWAQARGVSLARVMLSGYIAGSLLAGLVTAFTGPIAFVGLIVPHALRLRFGADHRLLIPGSFFMGAAFLAVCDTAARTVLAPAEIPVGVITALLGGPSFIWLLRSKRRSLWQ
jgi:iron complex transport system permease protein